MCFFSISFKCFNNHDICGLRKNITGEKWALSLLSVCIEGRTVMHKDSSLPVLPSSGTPWEMEDINVKHQWIFGWGSIIRWGFSSISRHGFLKEEKTDITGIHASKHLIQAEVKFSKIKLSCIAPHTSLISTEIDKVIADWVTGFHGYHKFFLGEKFCFFSSLPFPTHILFKKQCL